MSVQKISVRNKKTNPELGNLSVTEVRLPGDEYRSVITLKCAHCGQEWSVGEILEKKHMICLKCGKMTAIH